MCPGARFAEKWEEQFEIIFFLMFALNVFGRCLQELSVRVRKNKLEKVAEKKSAFNYFIGLCTIFIRLLFPKLQNRRPVESSDEMGLLEKTVNFFHQFYSKVQGFTPAEKYEVQVFVFSQL